MMLSVMRRSSRYPPFLRSSKRNCDRSRGDPVECSAGGEADWRSGKGERAVRTREEEEAGSRSG